MAAKVLPVALDFPDFDMGKAVDQSTLTMLERDGDKKTSFYDHHENEEIDDKDDIESIIFHDDEIRPSIEMKMKIKKALLEFRCLIEDAILGNYLLGKADPQLSPTKRFMQKETLRDITIWGVPLLPSKSHPDTDFVLLKFLKVKDFDATEAFELLQKTLLWRKEYKVQEIRDEKFGCDFVDLFYSNGRDRDGHPLFYNLFGRFQDNEFYKKVFESEEKTEELLRWKIRCIEKAITKLNFSNGGVDSIMWITDLHDCPGSAMKELHFFIKKASLLFEEYYPGLVYRNIVINTPFLFYASHALRSRLASERTKRKYVFARPGNATQTLLKFIAPESLPVRYGGLKRDNDDVFTTTDQSSELVIKANMATTIEFPASETGMTMEWDLSVIGWDYVLYKEEFIPDDEGSYRILLQNQKRLGKSVRNSFYISEPGKIVITIDNKTFKKKTVMYRSKAKPTLPIYIVLKAC